MSDLNTITETYTISSVNVEQLTAHVARLNKRARRIGCPEIDLHVAPSHLTHEVRTVGGESRWMTDEQLADHPQWEATGSVREWMTVTVSGDAPRFAGWHLIAVLEPLVTDVGTENIIMAVPGKECPKEYRDRDRVGECDHCCTERRRNQTFVCRHENGDTRMVGRNCLADFLGHSDPHAIARSAEIFGELSMLCEAACDEEWNEGGGGHQVQAWNLLTFVSATAATIVLDGWMSRGKAYDNGLQATADRTIEYLNPKPAEYRDAAYQRWLDWMSACAAHDRQQQTAADAIQWATELDAADTDDSDYLYNLSLVMRAGYVTHKTAGLAASVIVAHGRAQDKAVRQRELAQRAETSTHQGVLGDKIWRCLTLERVNYCEGYYGTTAIHSMVDGEGNAYTWFASNELSGFDTGDTCWVLATVKGHDEFRGIAQTTLSRCSLCTQDEYAEMLARGKKVDLQKQIEELTGEAGAAGSKADLAERIAELIGG